jgi:uncharacterized repeat protein (TIGR01451 family)
LFLWLSVLCSAASAVNLTQQINSSANDAEEYINSGFVSVNSSDLEINFDGGEPQLVALKFTPVNVPQGATICSNTYLQFEADESNAEVTNLIIYADDSDDAANLSATNGDISGRTPTTAQLAWDNVPPWAVGSAYQTPSISPIIQEIINRPGWSNGNDIIVIVTGGGGSRVAESRDGNGDEPRLHIEYDSGSGCGSPSIEVRDINNNNHDTEENATTGTISRGSSDLELVHEAGTAQLVGLRFTGLTIPVGATITNASIRFTAKAADADATSTTIFGELNASPANFVAGSAISARPRTSASVSWNNIPTWPTAGQSGANQTTPNLSAVIQQVVSLGGWNSGQDIVLILEGWGERTAHSFDGNPTNAPVLSVDYIVAVPGEANTTVVVTDSVDPVPVNTTYNYLIDVTNYGPDVATGITLTNVLPGALAFVSVFTDQGACVETTGTINCAIGSLAKDATVTVTVFVTSPASTQTLSNTVSVSASSPDSQTADNTDTETTLIGGNTEQLCYIFSDGSNRLSLYDTAAGTVLDFAPNGTNTIEAIAWDSANEMLYGADGGQFGSLSQVNGAWTAIGSGFGTANGALGNVPLNDIDGMAFNAFNSANVLYGVHERNGQDVLFQIDVNTGTFVSGAFSGNDYIPIAVISGNGITDDIAIDVNNGQMYGAVNNGGSTDTLILIDKDTGATSSIALITIDDVEGIGSDPSGQLWGTSGTRDTVFEIDKFTGVGSNERALNFGDYEAVDCVGVSPTVGADLIVLKTVDSNTPSPGQNITYTVTLTNNGAADATGIQIADALPAQVTYVSHVASQGSFDPVSGFWLVGSVASSGSRTLTVVVTVTTPLGNIFFNTASVSAAGQPDPDTANNTATVPVTVTGPSLVLVKASSASTASPGEVITYTLIVTNTGNGIATDVRLSDPLPPFVALGLHSYGDGIHFKFTDGATVSGLAKGTAIFDDGTNGFIYPAPTGPTQVFDPVIREFELPMNGSMNPANGSFKIEFEVQVGL